MAEEYLNIVEKIVTDYHLEDDLLSNDPVLKEDLSNAKSVEEKIFLKLYFGKREKNLPAEDVWPSFILLEIIEKFLSDKISHLEFKNYIIKKLKIDEGIAEKISQEILADDLIIREREKRKKEETSKNPQKEKKYLGIGQDLIK